MVVAIICFALSILFLVMSIFHFKEKGLCFNNAYLYASKEEREKMDKSPYYRQSAITFLILFFVFAAMGAYSFSYEKIFLILEVIMIVVALLYAIISSILINKK